MSLILRKSFDQQSGNVTVFPSSKLLTLSAQSITVSTGSGAVEVPISTLQLNLQDSAVITKGSSSAQLTQQTLLLETDSVSVSTTGSVSIALSYQILSLNEQSVQIRTGSNTSLSLNTLTLNEQGTTQRISISVPIAQRTLSQALFIPTVKGSALRILSQAVLTKTAMPATARIRGRAILITQNLTGTQFTLSFTTGSRSTLNTPTLQNQLQAATGKTSFRFSPSTKVISQQAFSTGVMTGAKAQLSMESALLQSNSVTINVVRNVQIEIGIVDTILETRSILTFEPQSLQSIKGGSKEQLAMLQKTTQLFNVFPFGGSSFISNMTLLKGVENSVVFKGGSNSPLSVQTLSQSLFNPTFKLGSKTLLDLNTLQSQTQSPNVAGGLNYEVDSLLLQQTPLAPFIIKNADRADLNRLILTLTPNTQYPWIRLPVTSTIKFTANLKVAFEENGKVFRRVTYQNLLKLNEIELKSFITNTVRGRSSVTVKIEYPSKIDMKNFRNSLVLPNSLTLELEPMETT